VEQNDHRRLQQTALDGPRVEKLLAEPPRPTILTRSVSKVHHESLTALAVVPRSRFGLVSVLPCGPVVMSDECRFPGRNADAAPPSSAHRSFVSSIRFVAGEAAIPLQGSPVASFVAFSGAPVALFVDSQNVRIRQAHARPLRTIKPARPS
jgi:hypothetical protein